MGDRRDRSRDRRDRSRERRRRRPRRNSQDAQERTRMQERQRVVMEQLRAEEGSNKQNREHETVKANGRRNKTTQRYKDPLDNLLRWAGGGTYRDPLEDTTVDGDSVVDSPASKRRNGSESRSARKAQAEDRDAPDRDR